MAGMHLIMIGPSAASYFMSQRVNSLPIIDVLTFFQLTPRHRFLETPTALQGITRGA